MISQLLAVEDQKREISILDSFKKMLMLSLLFCFAFLLLFCLVVQLAGAVEYTDWFSAER